MIKQAENNKPLNRKKGSGRTPKFNTPANRARLKKLFDHRRGVSLRKQARKWKCSPSTIANMLKSMKQAINCYKRKKDTIERHYSVFKHVRSVERFT